MAPSAAQFDSDWYFFAAVNFMWRSSLSLAPSLCCLLSDSLVTRLVGLSSSALLDSDSPLDSGLAGSRSVGWARRNVERLAGLAARGCSCPLEPLTGRRWYRSLLDTHGMWAALERRGQTQGGTDLQKESAG